LGHTCPYSRSRHWRGGARTWKTQEERKELQLYFSNTKEEGKKGCLPFQGIIVSQVLVDGATIFQVVDLVIENRLLPLVPRLRLGKGEMRGSVDPLVGGCQDALENGQLEVLVAQLAFLLGQVNLVTKSGVQRLVYGDPSWRALKYNLCLLRHPLFQKKEEEKSKKNTPVGCD